MRRPGSPCLWVRPALLGIDTVMTEQNGELMPDPTELRFRTCITQDTETGLVYGRVAFNEETSFDLDIQQLAGMLNALTDLAQKLLLHASTTPTNGN